MRKSIVFFIILFVCSPIPVLCKSLPLDAQPTTSFNNLYSTYETEIIKSEYETTAQYEARLEEFFSNEPVRYFDIESYTSYDAETQTLHVYVLDYLGPSCDPGSQASGCRHCHIVLPPNWREFRLDGLSIFDDDCSIIINNPNYYPFELVEIEWECPWCFEHDHLYIHSIQLAPTIAAEIRDNLKIRIGMKFNYIPERGLICREDHYCHTDDGELFIMRDYYLLGELCIISLYDDRDDSIYWQALPTDEPPIEDGDEEVDEQPTGGDGAGDSGASGGCFIATATYGSCMAEEVVILKNLQDNILLENSLGIGFVKFYYEISPTLADYIRNHEILRTATRLILMPLVYGIEYLKISVLIFVSTITAITLISRRRRSRMF